MKPKKVVLGDVDDYVEFEDKSELSLFTRLLCCFCLLMEPKSSGVLRLRKKVVTFEPADPALTAQQQEAANALLAATDAANLVRKQFNAATKIQSLARGRKGRKEAKQAYQNAIKEIDQYWRDILQARLDAKNRDRAAQEARMKVCIVIE
jgi:hypothetical protein